MKTLLAILALLVLVLAGCPPGGGGPKCSEEKDGKSICYYGYSTIMQAGAITCFTGPGDSGMHCFENGIEIIASKAKD